jgi:hypothetical protein
MIVQAEPTSHPIAALAEGRLKASPYPPIRQLVCEFDDGLLLLQGRLPSYFHKQLAQVAVADIVGVRQVINQIEVI